jgi:PAS domain S-box-containing protein
VAVPIDIYDCSLELLLMNFSHARRLLGPGVATGVAASLVWVGVSLVTGSARSSDFMPHGYCYLWNPLILWLNVISDSLIVLSYYCIPVALIYLVRRRRDLPFNWIFWMFGLFIVGCGTTHLMEIWTVWHASYALAGVIKALTGAISVATTIALVSLLPKALALPNIGELREMNQILEAQIVERRQAELELNSTLRSREQALAELAEHELAIDELRLAQTALEESQNQFTAIIQSAMDAIITVDQEQRIFIFNAAAERMFGCSAEEAAGRSIEHFIPQRFRGSHSSHVRRFGDTGVSARAMGTLGAIWGLRTNGEEFPLEASISQVESGGKKLFTVILRDISERVRLEQAQKEIAAANESTRKELADQKFALDQHAIVATTDVHGTITYVNDKFCQISKYSRQELIGKNHRILNSGRHPTEFFKDMYRTIAKGEVWHGEICNRAKDGSIYWVDTTIVPLLNDKGQPRQYLAIRAEITERRRVEEELRVSEDRFRLLLDGATDYAIYMLDPEGRVLSWNAGATRMKGYRAEEIIGANFSCFYSAIEQANDEPRRQLKVALEKGRFEDRGYRVRKDGSQFLADVVITPTYDDRKTLRGFCKVARDITERTRAEEALRESEAKFTGIIESAMDAIITVDEQQRVVIFNAAAERMFGCSYSEATGQSIERFIPQRFRGSHSGHIHRFREAGVTTRAMGTLGAIWGLRTNGEEFPLEASISQIESGGKKFFTVILRDITERTHTEETLRENAQTLDLAQVMVREMDSRVALWSHGLEQLYGYSRQEALGRVSHELLETTFPVPLAEIEATFLDRGRWEGELKHRKKDGSRITVAAIWVLRRNADGRPLRILEATTDITGQKEAEARMAGQTEELSRQAEDLIRTRDALREQSQLLELVLNSIGEGLVATDENGKFVIWNPAAEKMLGRGPANIPSSDWSVYYEIYQTDGVTPFPTAQLPLVQAMAGGEGEIEFVVRNSQSGKSTWLEATAHPMRDAKNAVKGGVVAFRDVTQRKNDERQIRELNEDLERRVVQRTAELQAANKELEAFTYSVSHDLRAPLRHISGFSKILDEEFGASLPPDAQRHLRRIQEGILRMGQLIDELLGLARMGRQAVSLQVTGLDSVIKDVLSLLEPEMQDRQVKWKIDGLPFVECDPTLIRQVLQNLISNALKYTRPRSPAVIEIGQVEKDGEQVFFVRDNGVGFSMKYADKLFGVFQRLHRAEDFEGTGIGLAIVQRIVHKHGGRIWAEAELDKGATFYWTLGAPQETADKSRAATAGDKL